LILRIAARQVSQSRGGSETRPGHQVGAIEENPRVHVPRDAVEGAVENVRLPHAGKIRGRRNRRRGRDPVVQLLERADRRKLRDPGVAELRQVGRGLSDEGGEQLLVRRRPRDLLDDEVQGRVLALEIRDEAFHVLALAPERPENQRLPRRGAGTAAAGAAASANPTPISWRSARAIRP
jgi:hypothetical protein